jgi:NADPH:quinone reductase-like Zn-dependent oxidoreductase
MTTALQMKSLITEDGELQVALHEVAVKAPGPDEVVVRVEASPINPSDQGVVFGPADISQAVTEGSGTASVLKAPMLKGGLARVKARLGKPLAVGNEGAGVVVEAGSSDAAQALMGKTVAVFGGAMYAQYRTAHVMACLPLNEGHTAEQGASCFVNPLTSLGMVETMRLEGHTALVHTAAASNLGQMLNRICQSDGVDLVNIVRKPEQVKLLKDAGAKYVVNSSADSFREDLTDALAETGATLGFDATGGGTLASEILAGMERAAARTGTDYSVYGSTAHKQVYLYGGLDTSATVLNRSYGMAWGVGGWLLPPFLERVGPQTAAKMRQRVADELTTTFASHYTQRLSLVDALQADTARAYEGKSTGEKYLIMPQT